MNKESLRLSLELYLKHIGILFLLVAGSIFIYPITGKFFEWFFKYTYNHIVETALVTAAIGLVLIATSYLIKRTRRIA